MSVLIKEVKTKKELRQWVDFPTKLYKNNPYYVPFLRSDEINTFTQAKNPAYEYCETKLFLAYKNNKLTGRIAGLINHAYNKKWNKNSIRFTRFDFIDDYEVSEALMNEIIKLGKKCGYDTVEGPMGFHDMDHSGALLEGYEELNLSITFYNDPYYLNHYERLGFTKAVDWVEYQLKVPSSVDPKIAKISDRLLERGNYKEVKYSNRKQLWEDAFEAFKLIDVAFSILYGTVPLTDKVIKQALNDYIPIVNLDYILSIKDKDNKIVGFGVLVPSIAKALKKSNGKLFPFGIFRLLSALKGKNDTLEMFFVAVDPEHQSKGIPAILITELTKICIKNNVTTLETGPELELNHNVQGMWKTFESRKHKRRRCFMKSI